MGFTGRNIFYHGAFFIFMMVHTLWTSAETFQMPEPGNDVVGEVQIITAMQKDTLADIAQRYRIGYDELVIANPSASLHRLAKGTPITLPTRYLLPALPHEGIVINLAEKRLYYFPPANENEGLPRVETFPISVGRMGWETPPVTTSVIEKKVNPVWYPPQSIRDEQANATGMVLPSKVKPGPENPLGKYALYLGVPYYRIHGTNNKSSIGKQVTHGCIRLYPDDIEHLYNEVTTGTPVRIINQPYKAGWFGGKLYVEIHPWLENTPADEVENKSILEKEIARATRGHSGYPVDWNKIMTMKQHPDGIPAVVDPGL